VENGHTFTDEKLMQILISTIRTHRDATEMSSHGRTVNSAWLAEDYANLTMMIDFSAATRLANILQAVASVHTADNYDFIAYLMVDVAIKVFQGGPIFADKRGQLERINPLAYKMRVEYSIACSVYFASSVGYEVHLNNASRDRISLLLLIPDPVDELARIFCESLENAVKNTERYRQKLADDGHGELMQFLEEQFTEDSFEPISSKSEADREISAESYFNLRSVADLEGWSSADTLDLIEAFLSPAPHSHLAFRRDAVSGDEWRRLYDWINRGGRHVLCSPSTH
jgi:hypothetical protein